MSSWVPLHTLRNGSGYEEFQQNAMIHTGWGRFHHGDTCPEKGLRTGWPCRCFLVQGCYVCKCAELSSWTLILRLILMVIGSFTQKAQWNTWWQPWTVCTRNQLMSRLGVLLCSCFVLFAELLKSACYVWHLIAQKKNTDCLSYKACLMLLAFLELSCSLCSN